MQLVFFLHEYTKPADNLTLLACKHELTFLAAARSQWWSSSLIDESRVRPERPCLQAPCLRQADDLACDGALLARRKVVSQPRSLASRRHAVCKHGRMFRQGCHHQAPGTTTGTTHAAAVGCGVEPSVACAAAPPKGTNSRLGKKAPRRGEPTKKTWGGSSPTAKYGHSACFDKSAAE